MPSRGKRSFGYGIASDRIVQETPSSRFHTIARADANSKIKESERRLGELEKLPVKDTRSEMLAFWVGSACAFGAGIWYFLGPVKAQEYFAGYLLGKALCHHACHHTTIKHTCLMLHACRTKLECRQPLCFHTGLQLLQDPPRGPAEGALVWNCYCRYPPGCYDPAGS